ncbi:UvrD-helicase domain-containing protein [Caldimonas brevitalea]|uniref:DNA 3'-5' helicase n=1 Tax=Caldimonas brevitalea TaxID=413882 RepID=A0A0G3BLU6_9BURK|nr:ATP-dependent helicase [Caldimonas brevitalea]AKJ28326.1 ATP-dependent DNA helicase UvrD/PcrA [Caldimonas brevitalea]
MSTARFLPKSLQPTDEQLAIQTATANTLVVEANAGAAKTTTLALRIAESWQRGIAPDRMLGLTYTEPAVQALRAALKKLGMPAPVVQRLRIETFEAFCANVLRGLEGPGVLQLESAEALKPQVWEAILGVEEHPGPHRDALQLPARGDHGAVEAFLRESLQLKGTMQLALDEEHEGPMTPERALALDRDYTLLRIYAQYENVVRRGGHPDRPVFRGPFDATYDLARLIHAGEPVEGTPGWPTELRVLVVDEMHDLNQAMFFVLCELLDTNRACYFCGAGDHDQVIHQVAGADVRFMQDELALRTHHRSVTRLPLSASFRFGSALASKAGRFARKRYASASAHETRVRLGHYDDADECVEQVLQAATEWRESEGERRMSEFAVLLRHPHQSVLLENKLLEADLAYATRGFESYLLRPEILLVRGLLAVATDNFASIDSPDTRKRIVEAFVFFCDVRIVADDQPEQSQDRLVQEAVNAVVEDPGILRLFFENQVLKNADPYVRRRLSAAVEAARKAPADTLLQDFLQALDIPALAASVFVEQPRRREALGHVEGLTRLAAGHRSAAAFFQMLNQSELRQQQRKASEHLVLGSIEAAKGLEYDQVLLPWLERGLLPATGAAERDEANLFYVGMTRARRCLTLLAHRERPSPYLAQLK